MIYLTSDLHLGHHQPFLYEPRGFKTIEEHDQQIVKNWNEVIKENDEVYCLGDIMLNDNKNGINLWNQLNGQKRIILGNHDTDSRIELLSDCCNTTILGYANVLKYQGYHFYLSHYPAIVSNYDANKPLKIRTINLCGHTHTKDKFSDIDKGLIYHCELDAHNNYPKPIDEIIQDIKEYLNNENRI